jgi:carbonic anhydrase
VLIEFLAISFVLPKMEKLLTVMFLTKMKILAVIALLSFASAHSWNYKNGATDWDPIHVCGSGREQSPIDIPSKPQPIVRSNDIQINFENFGGDKMNAAFSAHNY